MSRLVGAVVLWLCSGTLFGAEAQRAEFALRGHTRFVLALAFTPDGGTLFSGSDDDTLRRWDLKKRSVVWTERFDSAVTALACSPQGQSLAVGTWDGDLQIRESKTGKKRLDLTGHRETIRTLSYDASGRFLVSGSADDSLIVWDTQDGEALFTLEQGNEYDVTAVAFAPQADRIVSGDGENQLRLWDAETGEALETLTAHVEPVTAVAFSRDGKTIASGSWDDTVRLWDAANGQLKRTLRGHTADVTCVAFAVRNTLVLSASEDKTVRVWDVKSGRTRTELRGHRHAIFSLATCQDGRLLATGGKQTILVWKLPRPKR